jgi:hypothetical protein
MAGCAGVVERRAGARLGAAIPSGSDCGGLADAREVKGTLRDSDAARRRDASAWWGWGGVCVSSLFPP